MVGDDEARARAALVEMQVQLSQGPHIALQVAEMAKAEQIRRAFLELAKQFHPARFARMSPELQRMANEVFLGIKHAHDTMLHALGASTRPGGVADTGGTPIVPAPGTSPPKKAPVPGTLRGTNQLPPMRPGSPPVGRAATPARPTPAMGVPIQRSTTPPHGVAIPRTLTPSSPRPGSPPMRPSPSPATRPSTPNVARPTTPRTADPLDPGTIRYAGSPPGQRQGPLDEQAAEREALELMAAHNWPAARTAMQALASSVPQSKRYRALLAYARGRVAQSVGKIDDAAQEFQRALQYEPELVQARLALAEVRRR